MKNLLYLSVLFLLLSQACTKEEETIATCDNCEFTCLEANESNVITNDCIENWECDFSVLPLSNVDLEETQGTSVGDRNVFRMINSTEGSLLISDDEFTDILVFELNDSQNSFSVEDSDLAKMKVHYRRMCYCSETEFKNITSGCVQGEKQSDGTWLIQGSLTVSYSYRDTEVKFDARFSK